MANEDASAVDASAAQVTAPTESAPVEEQQLEVVTEGPELNPNDFQDTETEETEAEAEVVEETETEKPQGEKPLSPKSENRFQKLANEKRELERQLAEFKAREAQAAQGQELLNEVNPETGEYYTPQEIERITYQQRLENEGKSAAEQRQNLEIQQNQMTIASEASQVTDEVPILREFNEDGTKNPDFNPEIAAEYDSLLGDNLLYRYADGNVYTANTLRANGIDLATQATLVGAHNSPMKLAQIVAKAYNASAVPNQIKGQKATEKMLSQADNPTSAKPSKASAKDENNMSAEEYAEAHGLKKVWQ